MICRHFYVLMQGRGAGVCSSPWDTLCLFVGEKEINNPPLPKSVVETLYPLITDGSF